MGLCHGALSIMMGMVVSRRLSMDLPSVLGVYWSAVHEVTDNTIRIDFSSVKKAARLWTWCTVDRKKFRQNKQRI